MRKKIYISGKITGIESKAPALFEIAEQYLKEKGFDPVNPMKLEHSHDLQWHSYMKVDIKALCDCDAIYMLSNWNESDGAIIEHDLAVNLKMEVIYQ